MRGLYLLTCVLAGCGRLGFDTPNALGTDARTDGGIDAPLGPWSPIQSLSGANDDVDDEEDISLSSNKLEAFFALGPDEGPKILRTMKRATEAAPWSAPTDIAEINTGNWEAGPRLASNDLTLYFTSARGGNGLDIWRSTRSSIGAAWQTPTLVDTDSDGGDHWLAPCDLGLYVLSRETTTFELFEGDLNGGPPARIEELVVTQGSRSGPFLTADCLTLYYSSDERGSGDLFFTHRATPTSPWETPTELAALNDPDADDADPWMSPDGHLIAFSSTRAGTPDVYFATR